MAKQTCIYHPQITARWQCDHCQHSLCINCAKTGSYQRKICPNCKEILRPIAADNFIPPFWQNIPAFLAYPLQGHALFFILAWGVMYSILTLLPYRGIIIIPAIPAIIALFFIFLHYNFTVLRNTS